MLKATLKYTNSRHDEQTIMLILTSRRIPIVKMGIANLLATHGKATIIVNDVDQLYDLLHRMNNLCNYSVVLSKVKEIKENIK